MYRRCVINIKNETQQWIILINNIYIYFLKGVTQKMLDVLGKVFITGHELSTFAVFSNIRI